MNTLYAIGAILNVGLPLLTKFGEKPTWRRALDLFKPSNNTPSFLDPELLKLVQPIIEQLWRKPPPAPDEPLPIPTQPPTSMADLVSRLMLLVNMPGPNAEPIAPVEHEDKLAQLVACAKQLATAEPDFDVIVSITADGGVEVKQPPRVKVANAKPK